MALIVLVSGELLSFLIFAIVRKAMGPEGTPAARNLPIVKGIIERVVLFVGLLHEFPQILIAFGALKIGTRLHEEKQSKVSNDYSLVGNLLSVFLAVLYTVVTRRLWNLWFLRRAGR